MAQITSNGKSIHDIYTRVQAGANLETVLEETYPGADAKYWRTILANYNPNKVPSRRRTPRRRAGSRSRKVNHAAQVIGRSMLELVERVNGSEDEQTFVSGIDWDAPHQMTEAEMEEADRLWLAQHGLADQADWPEPVCNGEEVVF